MVATIGIDGKAVPFREGQSVLEAAREGGFYIPALCFHPRTGSASSCRICVVEVDGMEGLQTACSLRAAAGMTIRSGTEAVLRARRTVLELLLADGSHSCSECDADGGCELQEAARSVGLEASLQRGGGFGKEEDDSSPFISHRPDLCIRCGRCVRGCNETVVHEVLGFGGRGHESRVIFDDGLSMAESGCVQCGECVQLCPTASFTDRRSRRGGGKGKTRPVETLCPYCGVGCGITLHIDGESGRIVGVTGTEGNPASEGMLCVKGRYGWDFIQSPERLTEPLLRNGRGSFRKASWEEALSFVASRLRGIMERDGPGAIGGLSSAKCTNEENYLFQKFMRQVVGTNSVDHCARLCHSSTVAALGLAIGSGAMTNDLAGIGKAEVILVMGSDTGTAHPVIASRIRRAVRRGSTKLIVIDPRRIGLADHAAIYVRNRPGTDVAVLNGIMNIIIARGWHDVEYVSRRCEGFAALREAVAGYTPRTVEDISGVPARDLEEVAELFGTASVAAFFFAMGLTQHRTGTDNVRSAVNLQLLCGNIGVEGGGVNPLRGQCNVQGACDMGALPDVLPGYRKAGERESILFFEKAWGAPLPRRPGLKAMEMIEGALSGRVKGMYVMGENPLLSDPDVSRVKEALEKLELLVVQDIFLSETAEIADVVLPAACFAEKDGLYTNTERRVQRVRRALDPPGRSREDWVILQDLAAALGTGWSYDCAEEIQNEIRRVVPSYGGITWERVSAAGLQWPCPSEDHPGTPVLHRETFPRGRGLLQAAVFRGPSETADETYPLLLTTGRLLQQFHTGTMTRRTEGIERLAGPVVCLSPGDAAERGVSDGDRVSVLSRRGKISLPAHIDRSMGRGTIFIPFHFSEAAANILTNPVLDPHSGIPEFKVCAVQVEKM